MLIVYAPKTGEVLDNTGTNSAWPEGPPDDLAFVNTDKRGIDRTNLSLLRLHDKDDADLIAQVMTHAHIVTDGEVVIGEPHPAPEPPPPPCDYATELETAATWEEAREILVAKERGE